ncbi:MAG: outer rane porin, OmpC family [Herbaspirillum sp.]|jgi:predicted porin|nr:outer rane porin, OmpC family [Herbaspirillum sp.]
MKKLSALATIPLGLLVLSATPAQADNVTVFGILDTYMGYTHATGPGSLTAMQSGGLYASRIGFRGDEDLGNGMHTTFTLDAGIQTNTGAQADSTRLFGRQAWVGLGTAQYGTVRLGRQNSAQVLMLGNLDAFQGGTYASFLNNTGIYTFRYDNSVTYLSPDLAGFKFSLSDNMGNQAAGISSLSSQVGSLEYSNGPLYLGINHAEQNGANGNSVSKTTFAGGSYIVNKWTGYLSYYRGNNLGAVTTTNTVGQYHSSYSLSAAYQYNTPLKLSVGYGWLKDSSGAGNDAKQVSLAGFYALSKRTQLYATIERLNNKNHANYTLEANGPLVGANTPTPGGNVSGMQLGIVHFF